MDEKWFDAISRLEESRQKLSLGGGQARIDKQHASGKLTARERMEALFDDDTFIEINDMIESRATDFGMDKKKCLGDGVVTGYGKIHGRYAVASSQDFTVNGGSLGEAHAARIVKAMDLAMELKVPFISINDSGGARIEEGIDSLSGYGDIFYRNTLASGVIPQISVILGPCAGGACYSPAICDFIFMTDKTSQMYITGPAVVKSVTGEEITALELGGANVHASKSGVAHFVYDNDLDCLNGVRQLLGYLPQNNTDKPMNVPGRSIDNSVSLTDIVPSNSKSSYDVKQVIASIFDEDSFFEIHKDFAANIVVGFARLDGDTIGIVANQSQVIAGSLEIDSSDKAARFIRFCDCFNIPIVTLVDVPAFMPGRNQEHGGIIRHGAKMLFAYSEATVPKISVIMRKAYGGAYIAMNSKGLAADIVYAWPIAEIAVMGASGAVSIIGRKAIEAAEDKTAKREELIEEYNEKFMNPYVAAARGFVDEVIKPDETRRKITCALNLLKEKKPVNMPYKKHGNIPL